MRYSEYVEVGLDDIRLEEKKESDERSIKNELAKSEILLEAQEFDLKQVLQQMEIPQLKKID